MARDIKHFNNSINQELNPINKLIGHINSVESAKFVNFDDNKIVSGSHDGFIKIWDINSGKILYENKIFTEGIWQLSISNNKIINAISSKGELKFIDFNNLKEIKNLKNVLEKGYSCNLSSE